MTHKCDWPGCEAQTERWLKHHSPWSSEDRALLTADYAAYVSVPEIAAKLGRGVHAVRRQISIYGLRRSRYAMRVLRRAPEHLRALLGRVPDDQWLREYRAWRKAQTEAAREERRARLAASRREIDGSDTSRNEKVAAKRALGMTLEAIAQQHGITRERVRQITAPPKPATTSLRNRQRRDRLVEIWGVCPPDIRAAFLAKIGASPGPADAGGQDVPRSGPNTEHRGHPSVPADTELTR
jgi:hypothetical protein